MTRRDPGRRLRTAALAFAVLAALLAIGGAAPATAAPQEFRFEQGGHARIPFELRGQHVWMRGRVNGSDSVWIVVDTGASSSVIDDGLARRLSLAGSGEHEAFGAGGRQSSRMVHDVTIEMSGLAIHRPTIAAIDLGAIGAQGGRPMDVIVGYELFESCVVRFDYARGIMDVWDAKRAPRPLAGTAVPMTLQDNHPYVDGVLTVRGRAPLRGRFVIDTGSALAVLVAPDVAERESLTTALPRTLVTIARGVGGEIQNRVGRAESFALGDLRFAAPTVVMPEPGAGRISASGTVGNIGGQILGRCRVTFDYAQRRVHFEPGTGFDRRFEADMSGMSLARSAEGLVVRWVNAATPAAEAGLEPGDRVIEIDGEPAERVDAAALRLRFQEHGRVVRLRVERDARMLDFTLTLRRLL